MYAYLKKKRRRVPSTVTNYTSEKESTHKNTRNRVDNDGRRGSNELDFCREKTNTNDCARVETNR